MIKRVKFTQLYGYDQSDDFYEHHKDESESKAGGGMWSKVADQKLWERLRILPHKIRWELLKYEA